MTTLWFQLWRRAAEGEKYSKCGDPVEVEGVPSVREDGRPFNVGNLKKLLKAHDDFRGDGRLGRSEVADIYIARPDGRHRVTSQHARGGDGGEVTSKRDDGDGSGGVSDDPVEWSARPGLQVAALVSDTVDEAGTTQKYGESDTCPILVVDETGVQGQKRKRDENEDSIGGTIDMSQYDFGKGHDSCSVTGSTLRPEAHHLLPVNQRDRKKELEVLVKEEKWNEPKHGPRLTLRADIHHAWHDGTIEAVWATSAPTPDATSADVRIQNLPTRPTIPSINVVLQSVNITVARLMVQNLAHNCKKSAWTGSAVESDGPSSRTRSHDEDGARSKKRGRGNSTSRDARRNTPANDPRQKGAKEHGKKRGRTGHGNTRSGDAENVAPLTEENLIRLAFQLPFKLSSSN